MPANNSISCEFCNDHFHPRPQTANPRACTKTSCQEARQKVNERDWRVTNNRFVEPAYYAKRRKERFKLLKSLTDSVCEMVKVGATMLGKGMNIEEFRQFLSRCLHSLGVRSANKLYPPSNDSERQTKNESVSPQLSANQVHRDFE